MEPNVLYYGNNLDVLRRHDKAPSPPARRRRDKGLADYGAEEPAR